MKMKSTVIAMLLGMSFASQAATLETFEQKTIDQVQAMVQSSGKGEVCKLAFTGEAGPEEISIGVNMKSNTVAIFGYMKDGEHAIMPMMIAMNKETAKNFSTQMQEVVKYDGNQLVGEEVFGYTETQDTVSLASEKYEGDVHYFGIGDETSLVGGYFVDVGDFGSRVADCIDTASNQLN